MLINDFNYILLINVFIILKCNVLIINLLQAFRRKNIFKIIFYLSMCQRSWYYKNTETFRKKEFTKKYNTI